METTTASPVDNQLSIIEKSLPVFQQAGSILKENQSKTQKALIVGQSILDQWEGAWNITDKAERTKALQAADERSNKYLVNCSIALKSEKEARSVVTQIMDEMKKMFTSLENDIDKTKANTLPSKVQENRDTLAQHLAKEERLRREEADRLAAKQREAVDIVSKISIALNEHFNTYLLGVKQKMTGEFNSQNLISITAFQLFLKGYQPEYKRDHFNIFSLYPSSAYNSKEEIQHLLSTVQTESKYNEFNLTYKAEMGALAQDLLDKIPSKRSELLAEKERLDQAAAAAEQARIEKEKRDAALANANAAQKKRLQEEQRLAQEKEGERLEQLKKEQERAAYEKLEREEEEAEKMRQQAEQARQKAESEVEMKKQSDQTMIMFEQEASLSDVTPSADTRQGYDITVTHPAGFVEIFQYWFQNEGKNLGIDKLEKTSLGQMKAFVEKASHKQGRPCIDSKFLKFEQSFKAVNKKPTAK